VIDLFVDALDKAGVHYLVSVANGESAPLYFRLRDDPRFTVVDACREGEAVAIACGLHLGGRRAMLSMENFGLYECLDTLRAMPIDARIPIPVLVGYTARPAEGHVDFWNGRFGNIASQAMLAGRWTEPLLERLDQPYAVVDKADPEHVTEKQLQAALTSDVPSYLLVQSF
jgi:sulfopyruvate decarboxylase TPP-binding subunit